LRNRESIIGNVDWVILVLYFIMISFGWLSIYASSSGEEVSSIFDLSQRYGKQFLWIGLSVILIIVVLLIDAKFFSAFAFIFYAVMIIILIGVLFFGKTVAGSKSWFQIGNFGMQPAEFAKFTTALAIAKFLSMTNIDMRNLRTPVISIILIVLPALLILFQNDTGSALVYSAFAIVLFREGFSGIIIIFGLVMSLLFILTLLFGEIYIIASIALVLILTLALLKKTRKNYKSFIAIFILSSVFVFSVNYAFQNVLEPHQKKRINVLLGIEEDLKGAGYNVNQSKIAIGSGGFAGKGFRQGMLTKNHFVPEQSTDFIFCTVGEEWGFVGSAVVILLWAFTILLFIFVKQDADRLKVL